MTDKILISILVPTFNEEKNIMRAYKTLVEVFLGIPKYKYEIIFTDNHSTDKSFEILNTIANLDSNVRVIRFSKNVGYQKSLMFAYQAAKGDCSVQIDCDLQDSPKYIPRMLDLWNQGHHVVYGVRRTLKDGWLISRMRKTFYWLVNALSDDDLPLNAGEFRLVDRLILDELQKIEDITPYPRGLISSMGFSQTGFEYDREARISGKSKFPLKDMLSLATDGIFNHSLLPLRVASILSPLIGIITILVILFYIVGRLFFSQDWPPGFATITIILLLSIMLNALFLGIIGEYLGRVFLQSKRSSLPIIEKELNKPVT